MDIKETLKSLINSDNRRYSYIAIEKLITVMLADYAKNQGKEAVFSKQVMCDLIFPNGIDNIEGNVAVEIKAYRHVQIVLRNIYDAVGKFTLNNNSIDTLILILVNEFPEQARVKIEEKKKQLNFNLVIWDIDKLVEIFEQNEQLFLDTYNNINAVMLRDVINVDILNNKPTYIENRKKHIAQLHKKYQNDNVVLFIGAGTSYDAHIADWDNLISKLFVALIDSQLNKNHILINDNDKKKIIDALVSQNDGSPLLQTRFLRNCFEDNFEELVKEILYDVAEDSSDLLEEIGQLCIPSRGKYGIRAIINYNFDDLVEKNLKRLRVKHQSVYSDGITPDSSELGIYHVHGFLPQDSQNYENLTKSLLVFSEEGYHQLMIEPYNWANIIQLNYLLNNTCIFIGLSMTDPNLRRLLDIAAKKKSYDSESCKHYAIMKRLNITDSDNNESIKSFERANESLQESLFKELDINIIWIDDFKEIPEMLKQIKNFSENA